MNSKQIMVMFLDYTGLPRAWATGPASERAVVEDHARRQLEAYCAKQVGVEPDLADPAAYTMQMEVLQ